MDGGTPMLSLLTPSVALGCWSRLAPNATSVRAAPILALGPRRAGPRDSTWHRCPTPRRVGASQYGGVAALMARQGHRCPHPEEGGDPTGPSFWRITTCCFSY